MEYKYYRNEKITDFSPENIQSMYDNGFVFTRLGRGVMHQIDSVRVKLDEFELSSENRRILRKNPLRVEFHTLDKYLYTWHIGKMAKDFYEKKFGKGIMSANKIKELFTDRDRSNMNSLFVYSYKDDRHSGYCLLYSDNKILHYSYPFYDLDDMNIPNPGMAMMVKAVVWAKENKLKYIYLGSYQRYKKQFKGLQIYDVQYGWKNI